VAVLEERGEEKGERRGAGESGFRVKACFILREVPSRAGVRGRRADRLTEPSGGLRVRRIRVV